MGNRCISKGIPTAVRACPRVKEWRGFQHHPFAQPYRDPFRAEAAADAVPQWQKDLAHWTNRRPLYAACDFRDFTPRKHFTCKTYLDTLCQNSITSPA